MSSSNDNQHLPSTSSDLPPQQSATAPHLDANAQLANNGYAPNDSQLAGLVEAATAAADQDVSSQWAAAAAVAAAAGAAGHHHQLDSYTDIDISENGFGDANFGTGLSSGRHMRVPSHTDHSQSPGLTRTATKKRKRNDDNLDPALAGAGMSASQHQSHQVQQTPHGYTGESMEIRPEQQQSLSDARAVGIHSAAALFRQPSSNKKYTRPPISKMFSSLEISPENFLHLQAAAKNYMLDDEHPERRDCVGQRGKGDTEMVKLRLWNCVRQFLEAEGNGERFFGENVVNEGMGPRTYIWPRDQHKIISLVIPLLRRMVTNERQRQYAIETRKGGGAEERRRRKTDEFSNLNSPRFSPEQHLQLQNQTPHRDGMSPSMPPPPPQPMQPATLESPQPMNLGLTDLLLDGYTADWEEIGRCYDSYNEGFELDNLWSLSGLQQPDWRGLVAAVDSHYQVIHNGHYQCPPECENENINRILHADTTSGLQWRIGGGRNLPARDEFASSITRDVSRIIRENIASRHGHPVQPQDTHFHQPFNALPESGSAANPTPPSQHQGQTTLRINVLHNGKRIFPRFDLPAGQYPNIDTVKQVVLRRYSAQIPGLHTFQGAGHANAAAHEARESAAAAAWKVQVLLPDGLMSVQNQKDWTIAILSADAVDWMDGELKVLVEIGDGGQQ